MHIWSRHRKSEDITENLRVFVQPIKEELRESLYELEFLAVTSIEMMAVNIGVNAYEKVTREQIRSMIPDNAITLL